MRYHHDSWYAQGLRWLRPSDLISADEFFALERKLNQFYVHPPREYQEVTAQMNRDFFQSDHVFHRRIIACAGLRAKVLDVGCGPASACPHFLEQGADYLGVDLAKDQLVLNQRRFPDASFLTLHWRDLPILRIRFDLVVSFFVLEHILHPKEFLEASASSVGPGGLLAVLCPNFLESGYLPSQHVFGHAAGGLKQMLKNRRWGQALDEAFQRYIVYPRFVRHARQKARQEGAWIINLRPVCLEVESWDIDWDAVYMVSEDEVAAHIERLGFQIIERGAHLRRADTAAGYPDFCYVLGRNQA